MEIQEILKTYIENSEKKKDNFEKSERADIVKKFVIKLNEARKIANYKELPASFYAIKMAESGLKTNSDLYWFYRYCEDAKDFGKCWWWSLRGEKKPKIITRKKLWHIPENF